MQLISPFIPQIHQALYDHPMVIIHATPGSGKTTKVPASFLDKVTGRILVIEPRKVAARWAARFVASTLTRPELVGFIYRFENTTTDYTRLIYLTEGTFLKYVESNPLTPNDVVILDEFHERHLSTDLSFGWLVDRLKKESAPKVLLMSATVDESFLSHLPFKTALIRVTAPVYPLDIEFAPKDLEWQKRELDQKVMWGLQIAISKPGHILVFLPGFSEIQRVRAILEKRLDLTENRLLILHSQHSSTDEELTKQDGLRKIILSTNIAESSLTIEGVRVVVDAGLDRQNVYQGHTGREELQTLECSQSSCIQRAGRAARQNSGTCIRLFTEDNFKARSFSGTPEVLRSNLSETLLNLYYLKLDPQRFFWIDKPQETALMKAHQSLLELNLIDNNQLSSIGEGLKDCPLPLALARTWIEGKNKLKQTSFDELCLILASAVEPSQPYKLARRLMHKSFGHQNDLESILLEFLKHNLARGRSHDFIMASSESIRATDEIQRQLSIKDKYFIILDFPPRQHSLYAIEDEKSLLAFCEIKIQQEQVGVHLYDRTSWVIGSLVIKSELKKIESTNPEHLRMNVDRWLNEWQESDEAIRFEIFSRELFPHKKMSEFEWELLVEEFCLDRELNPKTQQEFLEHLRQELQLYFDGSFQIKISMACPEFIDIHPKKKLKVHYFKDKNPMIESYIQDFFGLSAHPSLLKGRLPLVIGLWGPHGRTQQITSDLVGFWKNHYPSILKELKIDYPRHFWPENPQTAEPILRKPRPPR